jgi:uncharacterized iron-regulated membrane protein
VNSLLVMVAAALFPVAVLGLLLWLTRLEETLPQAVRAAQRSPAPPPILAVPVRAARPAVTALRVPVQRPAPSSELSDRRSAIGA